MHEHFPKDWLRTLKNSEHYDGDLDANRAIARALPKGLVKDFKKNSEHYDGDLGAIFRIKLFDTEKDITNVRTKDIYAVLIYRTQNDASFKTKWENIFTETIKWKEVWQTLNSGVIQNYDYDMIYEMIRNIIAVQKNLHDWKIEPTPNYVFCNSVDSVLHAFFSLQ